MEKKNRFTSIMSETSDYDLVKIVTIKRSLYEQEALEAADEEIVNRNININEFLESHKGKVETEIIKEKVELQSVSSGLRFVHLLVDGLVGGAIMCIFLFIPITLFKIVHTRSSELIQLVTYSFMGIGYLGYYAFMEYEFQKTVGKYITGTKVVNIYGEKPTFNEIMTRTFCRIIPFDRLSFLFMKNGFHDSISKTLVIQDIPTKAI